MASPMHFMLDCNQAIITSVSCRWLGLLLCMTLSYALALYTVKLALLTKLCTPPTTLQW